LLIILLCSELLKETKGLPLHLRKKNNIKWKHFDLLALLLVPQNCVTDQETVFGFAMENVCSNSELRLFFLSKMSLKKRPLICLVPAVASRNLSVFLSNLVDKMEVILGPY